MIVDDMVVKWLERRNGRAIEKAGFLKHGNFFFNGDTPDFIHNGLEIKHCGVELHPVYRKEKDELSS